jgi:glycosyltransferase involved in cell wall biosynthesis
VSTRPTLLIVSYHFAPSPLVGAKRFSFLAREFARLGYQVHIVTNGIGDSPHGREDRSLPVCGTVHRVDAPFEVPLKGNGLIRRFASAVLRRLLTPVGLEYFWARTATRRAIEVAAKLPRGVVIATSPPHAALITGARVARRLNWPLILDYRDPWSAYDWPAWHRGWISQWFARRIESSLVHRSSARVLNTPSMRDWFEEGFPQASADRNFVVPNGFDAVTSDQSPPASGPVEIVHAGEIYGSRSLVPLLRAVDILSRRHTERPIRVTTYGAMPASEWQSIREAGLDRHIEERPRIPFAELFVELQRAHLLLAVVSEHMTYSVPYKIYDYMAAGRPILALAPRDAALHELLSDSDSGLCVEATDIDGIVQALETTLFSAAAPSRSRIDHFRWSHLAHEYVGAIHSVSGPSATQPASRTKWVTRTGS